MRERPSAHTTPALRLALALGCPRGASAAAMEHSPKDDRVAYAAGSVVVVEAFSSSSSSSSAPEEDGASSGEFPPSTREFLIGHAADVGLLRHSPDGELLATVDATGGVNLHRYPCVQPERRDKPNRSSFHGHASAALACQWASSAERGKGGSDQLLSVGGLDLCLLQWERVKR